MASRLVWAFAGRTYHIVGNIMLRLINGAACDVTHKDTHIEGRLLKRAVFIVEYLRPFSLLR